MREQSTKEAWPAFAARAASEGYLVVMWTPEELENVDDVGNIEDSVIAYGNELIAMNSTQEESNGTR